MRGTKVKILKLAPANKSPLWSADIPDEWHEATVREDGQTDWQKRSDFIAVLPEWHNSDKVLCVDRDMRRIFFTGEPDENDLKDIRTVFEKVCEIESEGIPAASEIRPDEQAACKMAAMLLSQKLAGKNLPDTPLYGSPKLCRAGKSGLVSEVIHKEENVFSIGLSLEIVQDQTGKWVIAPLFTRRNWVTEIRGTSREKINALVSAEGNHFRRMVMKVVKQDDRFLMRYLSPWPKFFKRFYGIDMPDPEKVAKNPIDFLEDGIRILLPHNPTNRALRAAGGSGVGMYEQNEWIEWLLEQGKDIIKDDSVFCFPCRGGKTGQPKERKAGSYPLAILYNPGYEKEASLLENAFRSMGREVMPVPVDGLSDPLPEKGFGQKAHEMKMTKIPPVSGAIVILPSEYRQKNDPKNAIRKGLAKKGILSQFIAPENLYPDKKNNGKKKGGKQPTEEESQKKLKAITENTLHDLDRALGMISDRESNVRKWFDCDPGFIYGVRNIRIPYHDAGKVRKQKVPFACRINPENMEADIFSPFFGNRWLPYPEAQLFLCAKSGTLYKKPDSNLQPEVFEKGIAVYERQNIGDLSISVENVIAFSHDDFNYVSEKNDKGNHIETTGVFRDETSFWWIGRYPREMQHEKIGFKKYSNRKKDSLTGRKRKKCAAMLVPVRGDMETLEKYIRWLYELSLNSIQYQGKSLLLPLPLHLLKKMEEYVITNEIPDDEDERR